VILCTPTVLADLEPPFAFFKQPYPWIRVNNSRHIPVHAIATRSNLAFQVLRVGY
jgi:hypothetical protein